jgi:hypothetical protein
MCRKLQIVEHQMIRLNTQKEGEKFKECCKRKRLNKLRSALMPFYSKIQVTIYSLQILTFCEAMRFRLMAIQQAIR